MDVYPSIGVTYGDQATANENRDKLLTENKYLSAWHYFRNDIIFIQFGEHKGRLARVTHLERRTSTTNRAFIHFYFLVTKVRGKCRPREITLVETWQEQQDRLGTFEEYQRSMQDDSDVSQTDDET